MSKLMGKSLVAALCATVFSVSAQAEGIESANVVGYVNVNTNAQYVTLGAPFVNVANGAKWELGQLIPNGISEGFDFIQFLEPNNAAVYLYATWYNYEDYGEEGGWCDKNDESILLDGLELTPGTAFLSNFTSGNDIKYTFSGAVIEAGDDSKVTVDVAGQAYPFVANPLPKAVKLGDITPAGINEGFDFIQFLESKNASVYLYATWYNYEDYGEEGGWCDKNDESILLDNMELAPGEAFLGNIGDGTTNLKFIFPKAL